MSNSHETIADIIAEMRRIRVREFQDYAARLEAALEREKAVIEADALAVGGIVGAAHMRETLTKTLENVNNAPVSDTADNIGDNAKLREALKATNKFLEFAIVNGKVTAQDIAALQNIVSKALAAPPRNCDKYATADEALKAQEQMFNDSNFANGECKLGCPECDNPRVGCKIAWLFAPATEKEGGAK